MPASDTSSRVRLAVFLIVALSALFVVPLWLMGDEPEKHRAVLAAEVAQSTIVAAGLKSQIADFYNRYSEFPIDSASGAPAARALAGSVLDVPRAATDTVSGLQ